MAIYSLFDQFKISTILFYLLPNHQLSSAQQTLRATPLRAAFRKRLMPRYESVKKYNNESSKRTSSFINIY